MTRAEQALAKVRAAIAGDAVDCDGHAMLGDVPSDAIRSAAGDLDCSLIVMGTRGLVSVEGLLPGLVAEQVVAPARLPVVLRG